MYGELRQWAGIDFYSFVVQAKMMFREELAMNLHVYKPTEYMEMKCFCFNHGPRSAGFAIHEGDKLVNMFSLKKGRADELVQMAIREGARRLDCYDGRLPAIYGRNGFVEVRREPFNIEYADPRWDVDRFGKPDVVFMRLGD